MGAGIKLDDFWVVFGETDLIPWKMSVEDFSNCSILFLFLENCFLKLGNNFWNHIQIKQDAEFSSEWFRDKSVASDLQRPS